MTIKKMCTFAKPVEIEIDGKLYDLTLDFGTAVDYQLNTGEDIMKAFEKLAKSDIVALCNLLGVMLKDKKTQEPVGVKFVKRINIMESLDYLTDKVLEVMGMSVLPADEESKKNKGKKQKNQTKKG
jgi:hypothetical protein